MIEKFKQELLLQHESKFRFALKTEDIYQQKFRLIYNFAPFPRKDISHI